MSQTFRNSLPNRRSIRPTPRTWIKHCLWLLTTFITTTVAGSLYPFGKIEWQNKLETLEAESYFDLVPLIATTYSKIVTDVLNQLFTDPTVLIYGISFSLSVLFILGCHEAGHYIACRIYGVDATLPYFIPTPPLIGPAGTLGAVIKILSPMQSRKAVFDIGVAGPIAGFIALLPIAVVGVLTAKTVEIIPTIIPEGTLMFSDPLLIKIIGLIFSRDLSATEQNAFYFAAWLGLLVTAMNLFPSGQLDGGHAIFAVFGETVHKWTGRVAFLVMVCLSAIGWFVYNSPSGILFTIILAIMAFVKHPQPFDQTPLDAKRKVIAIITLIIFVLSFVPFAIQIT
jgi:membrane-associated protease RseP (regulator of RpoE activity)